MRWKQRIWFSLLFSSFLSVWGEVYAQQLGDSSAYGVDNRLFLVLPYAPEVDFNPLQSLDFDLPKPAENPLSTIQGAQGRLNQEAQWVFSGMIFGFLFEYVPSDTARTIEEVWSLVPRKLIAQETFDWKAGSNRFDPVALVKTAYPLSTSEFGYRTRLLGTRFTKSTGRGEYPAGEENSRQMAVEAAIKEAIRSLLRTTYYSKPSRITGEILLKNAPSLWIEGSQYWAQVDLLLQVDELSQYRDF